MSLVETAKTIFRNDVTEGVPESGAHEPSKASLRNWGTYLESIIAAGTLSDAVWKDTQALLNADLAHAADTIAVVHLDSTAANNGLYKKVGSSGSGSWTQLTTFLPGYQFVTATDDGSSTANAWTMDTSPHLPAGDGVALIAGFVPATNTSATVTASFDGGATLAVKTVAGADPAIGGLVAGDGFFAVVSASGTELRLLTVISPYAAFDHQGTWAAPTTYTENQVVTGSDNHWYQLKAPSSQGDDPVGSVTGDWLDIGMFAVPAGSIDEAELSPDVATKLNNPISLQSEGVDVASRTKLDILGSGYKATDDSGNNRVRIELVDQFVTPFDYGGVGDGSTDDTAAIQAMWGAIKSVGGKVKFCGRRWRLDGEVNMRIDSASDLDCSFDIDATGAAFDFSNNPDTAVVSAIKIGSDAGVMAENAHYTWGGGEFIGPIAGVTDPGEAGVAAMNMTALDVKAAYNLHLKDIVLWGFRWGLTVEEVYTNLAENVVAYGNYVGIELRDNCTHGKWIRSGGRNGRFGMILRPSTDTGSIYGQTFDTPLLEGNAVGVVHDPRNGLVNSITYREPYLEAITRDAFRIGRSFDYDDATNKGVNRLGRSQVLAWIGGVWSPQSAWGDPNQDAILFNDTGSGTGQPDRILLLNLPSGVSTGINDTACTNVTQLP